MHIKIKTWIHAFRLRTLPLSISSIVLASFLAAGQNRFSLIICVLAILTTLFLQILSNLANDYGDFVSGKDNEDRIGPQRTMQSGSISHREMKMLIGLFIVLSLLSGVWLIYQGTKDIASWYLLVFFLLGLGAIAAAMKYTMGKNPYGYHGLGDVFVFMFFGLAGVLGTYFLHTNQLPAELLLPASSVGFLSMAVLNLNNMRDREADQKHGKNTLAVILGTQKAKRYHYMLIVLAWLFAGAFVVLNYTGIFQLIFLHVLPLHMLHLKRVYKNTNAVELDPELKKVALSTLLFSILLGLGFIL